MEYIPMIMSGLALLAAFLCLFLLRQEKKRNEKRNAAALQYVDRRCDGVCNVINERQAEYTPFLEERFRSITADIQQLKDGIVPDYNEALKAKESVDLFNEGISNLLNFDPVSAAKELRKKSMFGTEGN